MRYSCHICHGVRTPDAVGGSDAAQTLTARGWTSLGDVWTCPICGLPFAVDLPDNAGRKSKKIIKLIADAGKDFNAAGDTIEKLKGKLETELDKIEFTDVEKIQSQIDREIKKQLFAISKSQLIQKSLIKSLIVDAQEELNKTSRMMLTISKQDQANEKEIVSNEADRSRLLNQAHVINTQYRSLSTRKIELQSLLQRVS